MKKIVAFICVIAILTTMTSPVYAAKKDTKAPTITKTNPADSTAEAMVDGTIVIRFSEAIKKGTSFAKITIKELETTSIAYTCVIEDNFLKITPKADLKYNKLYSITIPAAAVKDIAGNNLKKSFTFKFITEVDPAKISNIEGAAGIRYMMELEAVLKSELTPGQISYFMQLLQMIGINAEIKDYYKVDDNGVALEETPQEETSGATN